MIHVSNHVWWYPSWIETETSPLFNIWRYQIISYSMFIMISLNVWSYPITLMISDNISWYHTHMETETPPLWLSVGSWGSGFERGWPLIPVYWLRWQDIPSAGSKCPLQPLHLFSETTTVQQQKQDKRLFVLV